MANVVQGIDVYQSDEFKALCKRFGIQWELYTKDIIIQLPVYGAMLITQSYVTKHPEVTAEPITHPEEKVGEVPKPEFLDTSSLHNDDYTTKEPLRQDTNAST